MRQLETSFNRRVVFSSIVFSSPFALRMRTVVDELSGKLVNAAKVEAYGMRPT